MARNRQKEEEILQNVLDRLVAVLRDADPTQTKIKQVKDMEKEFLEKFLPFAKRYCSPIRRDYDEGYEIEALYEVLRTIESKCQAEQHPEIQLSYVKKVLPKRYLTIRKAGRSVFTDETVSLDESPLGSEENERLAYTADPHAHNPLDILIAQEEVGERLKTVSRPKRALLDMLKEIWTDPSNRLQFRDEYLVEAPNRLACFNQWGLEFESAPSASELMLNKRVLDWYYSNFETDRRSYDTTKKRLKADLSQFLTQQESS